MNILDYSKQENRVLGNILREQARAIPDQDFIVSDDRHISYAEGYEQAKHYAVGLKSLGIEKGDRVCIFMGSCPEYILLTLGCNLLGAQWVPVNTDYRGEWLQQTIEDSEPKVLVTDSELLSRVEELEDLGVANIVVKDGGKGRITLESLLDNSIDNFNATTCVPGDVASIMWTSGTTGRSKGVMQPHNVWVHSATSFGGMAEFRPGDVIYSCLPLYNSAAWTTSIYPGLISGVTIAMDPAFSARHFWERIRFYKATHAFTLGAMHIFLWNAPESPDDADNPLRCAVMTPMPAELHRPFCKRFGIERIHQGFGQSEAMVVLRCKDDGINDPIPNSLGESTKEMEVALLDDNNQPVPVGEIGEFCVKPKQDFILFSGYFNNPEETEKAWAGGWYHMGDLGRQDEQGNYFFADRKKDLIRYKGRSVSSVAIESVARRHPAIKDVAAYGITSEELASEHEIMLAVVLKPGASASAEEIARFINKNAPYFFVPRFIDFLDELPMTPTQKVRKVELRERGVTETTWDSKAAGFKVER